jgi:CRP-like cAMP-binding protein
MQRVIGYLLQHVPDQTGSAELALPTSKQVIASRLNLTPETLSRILHELAEAQLIRVHGRQITIIDLARLRQFGL